LARISKAPPAAVGTSHQASAALWPTAVRAWHAQGTERARRALGASVYRFHVVIESADRAVPTDEDLRRDPELGQDHVEEIERVLLEEPRRIGKCRVGIDDVGIELARIAEVAREEPGDRGKIGTGRERKDRATSRAAAPIAATTQKEPP